LFGGDDDGTGTEPPPALPPDVVVTDVQGTATLTRQQARVLADAIYYAVYGSGDFWTGHVDEDEDAVVDAMTAAQNDPDVLLIQQEYGVRSGAASFHGALNLVGTLHAFLSDSDLARINSDYQSKGITFRF
ncbi:MAG: hypothetical protein KC897_11230, partial [Candidatus Omnitrophica bacterium]|nr:hypothetical protein [Candidatus Omnitrophota bacterium]